MTTLHHSRLRSSSATDVALSAITAAAVAIVLGGARHKLLLAAVGGLVVVAAMLLAHNRERLLFGFLVVSLAFVLHKSFGPIALDNGGPPSIYLSSIDVCVLALYGMWFWTGELASDLRRGLRHPVMIAPLVGIALMLPSLLVTSSLRLGFAEVERLTLLYLLFVYVAVRTSKRDVVLALWLLGGLAAIELTASLGQWITHSPLGLSFLGLPTELGSRVTNTGDIERPFGTITHPVFLGAFVGPIAALFFALSIGLSRLRNKLLALAVAVVATLPIVIAEARSAALGLAAAVLAIVVLALVTHRLTLRLLRKWLGGLVAVTLLVSPLLLSLYHADLFTSHFSLELQARGQLVNVGFRIFHAHPLLGTGLNTFQQVMDHYTSSGVIFDGNPVHNIYLLQAAETGIVGLLAIPVVAIPLLVLAVRTTRAKDRVCAALGIGFIGVVTFFAVEEMFVFSLREDHPRSMFWLLAGLMVAAARFSGLVPGRDGGSWPTDDEHAEYVRRRWERLTWSAAKPVRIDLPRQRQPLHSLAQSVTETARRLAATSARVPAVALSALDTPGAAHRAHPHRQVGRHEVGRHKVVVRPSSRGSRRRRVAAPALLALLTTLTFSWTPAAASSRPVRTDVPTGTNQVRATDVPAAHTSASSGGLR